MNDATRNALVNRPLDLSMVEPVLVPQAQRAFDKGDALGLLISMSSDIGLAFVFDNTWQLIGRGIYEKALVHAFVSCRVNHCGWSLSVIEGMFRRADRAKLLAVGDSLPGDGPFTIYRGVAGQGRLRRISGLSWTASLDCACWFATRFSVLPEIPDPAVYVATVQREEVFAYIAHQEEAEFIVRPKRPKRLAMTLDEMKAAAERRREAAA